MVSCIQLLTRTHHHQQQPLHFSQHAKILSPELVSVHTFPDLPDYNPDEVFLLYPSKVCTSHYVGLVWLSSLSSSELTFHLGVADRTRKTLRTSTSRR